MAKFEAPLSALLDEIMNQYNLPGYDCSVWQNGKEIFRRIKGVADLESGTPVTENTLYNMYSNTKVVTCVAAMQLYELELTEKGKGLDIYCVALDTQQEDFLAFLEEAGLQSPFLPGRAAQLHETLKKAISPNTKDVPPGTSLAA